MQSKVIVIIDDDSEDQEVFIDAVKEIDDSILCLGFDSGEEAIKIMKAEAIEVPDLIFLDLNMPRFSGKQCLAEIKKLKKLCHTPVIIYSTSSDKKDEEETRKLGASFFLTKPSRFDDLRNSIKQMLSLKWHVS